MLEANVDEKYYLSEKCLQCFLSDGTGGYPRRERFLQNINRKDQDRANSITTHAGSRPTDNFVMDDTYKCRPPRFYDSFAPTLRSGNHELKVVASRERGENNAQHLEAREDGLTNTLTSVQKDNYIAIRANNKKGYDLATEGDSINTQYPNSTTRRGRVGHGVAQTIQTDDSIATFQGYRIRKLTPKECWRLMGFDDEDFERAAKENSNTQLYKQAGNSIVVDVLEGILTNLLKEVE